MLLYVFLYFCDLLDDVIQQMWSGALCGFLQRLKACEELLELSIGLQGGFV
jgi:hypothetical protein